MNKFSLSFQTRQLQIRVNSWLILHTAFGEFIVQYIPCSEVFTVAGCWKWTYTFCYQETDVPSGLDVCSLSSNTLEPPYLSAINPINFEDTLTIDVQGNGSESLPYNFNVIIDTDLDNDLELRANGLFTNKISAGDGQDGTDGTDGTDGGDGTDGTDGTDGNDGQNGANGAGPPVGMIFPVASVNAPANTEPLWGQLLVRTDFPELWAFAQASGIIIDDATWVGSSNNVGMWSTGDGSLTFRLPNMRGYFPRAWNSDDGAQYPDDDRDLGTVQGDAIRELSGQIGGTQDFFTGSGVFSESSVVTGNRPNLGAGSERDLNFNASNVVPTADENRPKNIAYMYVVQSKSIV